MKIRHKFLICVFSLIILSVLLYTQIYPRENFSNTCNSSISAVTLYTGENFSGTAIKVPGPKRWNAFDAHKSSESKLSELGYRNDSAKSIQIEPGYKVTLFQDDINGVESYNPNPMKITLTKSASSLKEYNYVKGVSSLVIECDDTQPQPIVNNRNGNHRSATFTSKDQYCLPGGKLNPEKMANAKQELRKIAKNGYSGKKGLDAIKLFLTAEYDKSLMNKDINKTPERMTAWNNCFGIGINAPDVLLGSIINDNTSGIPTWQPAPLPPPPPPKPVPVAPPPPKPPAPPPPKPPAPPPPKAECDYKPLFCGPPPYNFGTTVKAIPASRVASYDKSLFGPAIKITKPLPKSRYFCYFYTTYNNSLGSEIEANIDINSDFNHRVFVNDILINRRQRYKAKLTDIKLKPGINRIKVLVFTFGNPNLDIPSMICNITYNGKPIIYSGIHWDTADYDGATGSGTDPALVLCPKYQTMFVGMLIHMTLAVPSNTPIILGTDALPLMPCLENGLESCPQQQANDIRIEINKRKDRTQNFSVFIELPPMYLYALIDNYNKNIKKISIKNLLGIINQYQYIKAPQYGRLSNRLRFNRKDHPSSACFLATRDLTEVL